MDDDKIKTTIQNLSPSIVGISVTTPSYSNGLKFAKLVKECNPDIKVVMGGPHPSVLFEDVAKEKNIDFVVIGEGEQTMLEIADCLLRNTGEIAGIKGIAYSDNGKVKITEKRPFIKDPDVIPFPARYIFPYDLYGIPNVLLTSRGSCPYSCYFCAVNNIWEGRKRSRRPERVMEEILNVIGFGTLDFNQAGGITFSDDTFTIDRERVIKLCQLIRKSMDIVKNARKINGFPLWWRCTTRVDLVDSELINEMHDSGCQQIQYGIEAGSEEILDTIGKKITPDQIKRAIDLTINSGIDAQCSFMFPHPEDTEQTIKEQIQLMKDLYSMGASVILAKTTPFPGTYLYNNAEKLGVNILSHNWDDYGCRHIIITTKYLSSEMLYELNNEIVQQVGMLKAE